MKRTGPIWLGCYATRARGELLLKKKRRSLSPIPFNPRAAGSLRVHCPMIVAIKNKEMVLDRSESNSTLLDSLRVTTWLIADTCSFFPVASRADSLFIISLWTQVTGRCVVLVHKEAVKMSCSIWYANKSIADLYIGHRPFYVTNTRAPLISVNTYSLLDSIPSPTHLYDFTWTATINFRISFLIWLYDGAHSCTRLI